MLKSLNIWKVCTIGLLLVALLVLYPFLSGIRFLGVSELLNNISFKSTLQTTLLNATISAIILVVFGFWGALALLKIPMFSITGKNLGVLIIPITLGNISIAFICKLLLGETSFFATIAQGGPVGKLSFLLLLELYQYGFLFVYLFWMQLQNINYDKLNFATATRFSFFQKLKDIYIPHTRNLWLLLASMAFVFTLYEESKIAYLFKVSQGTNSELITNWLTRTYQTNLLVSPDFARNLIFNASATVFVVAILGLILLFLILYYFIKKLTRLKFYPRFLRTSNNYIFSKRISYFFGLVFSLTAITPIVFSFTKINISFNISHLGFPLLMTFIATVVSALMAILLGITARLGWKQMLSSFSQQSLLFFILLFVLLLVPPLVLLITGYKWMSLIGYSSFTLIYVIWIVGHVLLTLPVLGSFVLFNHFRVGNNELDYLQVYKLGKRETIRYSFLKRFKAEYLLLFVICYSFVWNEAVLNNLFSDFIPSFVSGMKMLITGRGVDYDKAFGYLLTSFAVASLSAGIWRFIIERAHKQERKEL
ncbi:MAG: hypothetical protein M0Q41_02070 [Bacteroidales bacterium]|nr:hypothetical protein [Acholeplasmataceae bacterium]MCK9447743.1 hypothetical protein [Bacteroidales bacterium]